MEHWLQQTQRERKQKLTPHNQVWTAMCDEINLAADPKYTQSLTTRVSVAKQEMDWPWNLADTFSLFSPPPPREDAETDAVKFCLISVPYAGSREGATRTCFSSHEHILRWGTARFLPSSEAPKFSYAGNMNGTRNGMAEQHISGGPEGALGKKELVLNNPPVLHMHQPLTAREILPLPQRLKICRCSTLTQGSQGRFK